MSMIWTKWVLVGWKMGESIEVKFNNYLCTFKFSYNWVYVDIARLNIFENILSGSGFTFWTLCSFGTSFLWNVLTFSKLRYEKWKQSFALKNVLKSIIALKKFKVKQWPGIGFGTTLRTLLSTVYDLPLISLALIQMRSLHRFCLWLYHPMFHFLLYQQLPMLWLWRQAISTFG